MCNFNTLKANNHGYVVQCIKCNNIQVAYGTMVLSFSRQQFIDYVSLIELQYAARKLHPEKDKKEIQIPTSSPGIAMIYTVNELCLLLDLLKCGWQKLSYNDLFVINEN